ncbi:ABC transporter permease/M1 family aminopeptidase [Aureibacter tunicatorum]|uniref:ABC-type transport system involved in multi-copper enzyme maturation permease subunit n=1 Tax=Aureibacter tunicatorum TaxID=866807 RepID=A0AAE3XNG8_9BACT|nr:M1 family aminopeptidase [Aureibacter tunicatorum]MDR6241161.1 ABC-type transport system involved in multi-copper enzyme maturation permease subunit [Aureibacter tunicatorum]BDD03936.1 membrane protein [Aureibacter tunicatorum]
MLHRLLQFELFYQAKQRALPIFILLFLGLGYFMGSQGFAPAGVNFNSVYQIYFHTGITTLGSVFVIMFFAVSGILRDQQHQMESLIFSSSVQKSPYFWSRFIGTFTFSVIAVSPFLLGYVLGNYYSDLDPERLAEFKLIYYLQPWLYLILPNVLMASAIIFSVSTLTKNTIATYASAVFIYVLYFISSMFLNSPMMAQSVPASPESMALASLADPFGFASFFEQTQFWTPFQKNTQLISLSGLFLFNRLIWIGFSFALLAITYRLFSFRKISKKSIKKSKAQKENIKSIAYRPIHSLHNFKADRLAFFSLVTLELKNIFKSLPFIVIFAMWLVSIFSELTGLVIRGSEYNVPLHPFTNQMIDQVTDSITLFSLILIIFYSAEIVWRERSLNLNSITDATPVKNSILFASKFIAILSLPVLLISSAILMCVGFQISLGYNDFEWNLYAMLFYHYGIQLAIYVMITLFINSISKNKFMGMGIFAMVIIISFKAVLIGLEHPLFSIGFMPRVSYSNMSGFAEGNLLFNHLSIFWSFLGIILTGLSFKIWNRGTIKTFSSKIKQLIYQWNTSQAIVFSTTLIGFLSMGILIFYQMNIDSEYINQDIKLNFRENYERKFKQYENMDKPYEVSRKTEVAIYPNKKSYHIKANYILKNKNEQPISEVFITEKIKLKSISIANASLIQHDSVYGTYLFKFHKPIMPEQSILYQYELINQLKNYEEEKSIVANGSYITHRGFEPVIGYRNGLEIIDKTERKKRNLPEREEDNHSDEHIHLEDLKVEKARFETIVSTSSDQVALSSGKLIRQWTENDRNFYHFKATEKILPTIGYFSAKYATQKINHQGISIEQYFDPKHDINVEEIELSSKQTLDYCQKNFGRYAFDHLRIAEIPSHWGFGGFAHPGVISMTEDRLYLTDVSDENTFNLVAKRTIHEVAHQWWGHALSAKPILGGSLLVEGLAKYTEAVVMEKRFGKRALYTLSNDARRKYFSGRSFANKAEPPAYKVFGQSYIAYGKSYHILMSLRDLIGEAKVNQALKKLTNKFRKKNTLEATTVDFLNELYLIAPENQHELIDDWFKKVITYDLSVEESHVKQMKNGKYEVHLKVKTKRNQTIENGAIQSIEINEPIMIGIFDKHPSEVSDDSSMIYYETKTINKEFTEFKIIVDKAPEYIGIDPFGTRSDENLADNVKRL